MDPRFRLRNGVREGRAIGRGKGRRHDVATITTLAALGGCERELRSHIQTALNVGVAPERIVATFLHMAPYAGFPRTLNALFTAKEVFELRGVTVAGLEKPDEGEEKK